ncbi:MAG TPA: hydantoinase B/oxoprolinase family protein [Trebonia sp.]|nr:hydantoinase B/oxoprolinase family protein [Trebonia sp.]
MTHPAAAEAARTPSGTPSGTASGPDIDPITFEVIRHKLSAVTEEQAATLKAVSGSPVVTDATDFNNGIYLADGSIVTMGPQVLFHSGSMASVVRNIIKDYSDNPGIGPGDMFILNDPYRGALHQSDVSIVAPVFAGEDLVAWVGSCAHEIDVGGMNFGSWSFKATEIQQEAMLLPGLKIVEGGEIRNDVWQTIMGMSRLPQAIGLDFKAMIAANGVASRRLLELFDRYGLPEVQHVMRLEIEHSERTLRDRLAAMPDGTFRAVDFLEHDGHTNELYAFRLAVTKRGDELTFDFTGTSRQAPGFINCTYSGLMGGVFTAVLAILGAGLRWNEGLLRPVNVIAAEGTVCNATWPAPVSSATISSVWVVCNVAVTALSRLAAAAEHTAPDANAVTKGSMTVLTLNGTDRDGERYGTFLLDSTAGGGGAYQDQDGLTASGDFNVPRPMITNVESHEAAGPVLYLYRSIMPDSAGPGRMAGGSTVGLALTPHDTDELRAMIVGHGVEVPNSTGLFGGLEGSCNVNRLLPGVRGTDPVAAVGGYDDLLAWPAAGRDLGAKPGFFPLRRGDVLAYSFQGGGGFGDPVERDPALVASDLALGYLSRAMARDVYGVIVDVHGAVDAEATSLRRADIRRQRCGGIPPNPPGPGLAGRPAAANGTQAADTTRAADTRRPFAEHLLFDASGGVWCDCGLQLSTGPAWKEAAVSRVVDPASHGPLIRLHERLELREHSCPGCGTLLESEVAVIGEPDLVTAELSEIGEHA